MALRRNPTTGPLAAIKSTPIPVSMAKPERTPENDCQRCHGAGWLRMDVPFGHPQFGKPVKCQCVDEYAKAKARIETFSWLGMDAEQVAELEATRFQGFEACYQTAAGRVDLSDAYQRARDWAEHVRAGGAKEMKNVLFAGPFGVGKTRLAVSMMNELRLAGVPCLFVGAVELFDALYAARFEQKRQILEKAAKTHALCIDDLDKLHIRQADGLDDEEPGSYQRSVLFELLNQRYRAHLPTIVTTNKTDDLKQWLHGSVLSRLFGADRVQAIAMRGPDYRMRKSN